MCFSILPSWTDAIWNFYEAFLENLARKFLICLVALFHEQLQYVSLLGCAIKDLG